MVEFIKPMDENVEISIVFPTYNESANIVTVLDSIYYQESDEGILDRSIYEVIIVDNNSTDNTTELVMEYAKSHPDFHVYMISETEQGVAWARKTGMDIAAKRSRERDDIYSTHNRPFYIYSADADCRVDPKWAYELKKTMDETKAAIGVCNYYYPEEHFQNRKKLWTVIEKILRARHVTFSVFGGFPDGKGFAVLREDYEKVGGVEIFYQLKDGKFVCHLSDDWDFGIKVRAMGGEIVYSPNSKVEINPRRIDNALDETIYGLSYGKDGIITMRDIRPEKVKDANEDLTDFEAETMWNYAIKDFTPKNIILPLLLTEDFFEREEVIDYLTDDFAQALKKRIKEVQEEMAISNFIPIHLYKVPSFRLYFEFMNELFDRMRAKIGEDMGCPPPLPECLQEIKENKKFNFNDFVYYYCEDRESGEAHNYFGNGGVF